MAYILTREKQIAAIAALAEGNSIRATERMTGVNRNTIMNLGVRVGQGCADLMDQKMRNLDCKLLQFDEIWGYIGKKQKHLTPDDDPTKGDVWTFCAIDADTKLVPSFRVGKRTAAVAQDFVADVSMRMKNRVQISTDGLAAYVDSVELAFGSEVDYGMIIKTYGSDGGKDNERRYSAPDMISIEKRVMASNPNYALISTSYIERLNATIRLHVKRLTRLTHAFSKKFEHFEAAIGLHFAYYNFVRTHNSLKMTPATAAGVSRGFWSVADLLKAIL